MQSQCDELLKLMRFARHCGAWRCMRRGDASLVGWTPVVERAHALLACIDIQDGVQGMVIDTLWTAGDAILSD